MQPSIFISSPAYASMMPLDVKHLKWKQGLLVFLTLAVGYAFFVGMHSVRLPAFDAVPSNYWHGERVLTNVDGYYFLRMARDVMYGTYSSDDPLRNAVRPERPPLLASITATASSVLDAGLMDTAFILPVALAGIGVFLYLGFGGYLGSYTLSLLAVLFSTTSHIWLVRSKYGWFDTDCLNPLLLWGVILFLALSMRSTDLRKKGAWLTCALATGLLFNAWWHTGAAPLMAIAAMTYVASAILPGQSRLERKLKLSAIPVGAIFAIMAISGLIPSFLPAGIQHLLASLHAHMLLAFKGDPGLFPEVGSVIGELGIFPLSEFIREISGHWGVFVLSITGLVHMAIKRKDAAIFIGIPTVVFTALSFTAGNRFIIFLTPAYALGLAWFCINIVYSLLSRVTPAFGVANTLLIGSIVMIPGLSFTLSEPLEPIIDANMAQLFEEAGKRTEPDTLLWGPWGPGYAVQFFANRRTLVDGGIQTPHLVYITESPLASKDTVFSRNWIRFFSKHINGIRLTASKLQVSELEALIFLRQVLKSPEAAITLLKKNSLEKRQDEFIRFLFPDEANTALVFTSSMLFRTVWVSKGLWDPATDTMPETPVYGYPYEDLALDRENGFFIYGAKRIPYSKIMFVNADSLSHDVKRVEGPVAILVHGNKMGFMIEREYFENLGFRLLFVYPDRTRDFRPLIYHPFVGGVWKVD